MTEQEQNIAIAQWMGWYNIGIEKDLPEYGMTGPGPLEKIPNYTQDLNAIHEAEKKLSHDQREVFLEWLGQEWDYCVTSQFEVAHATAAQRSEALLKTIGEWKCPVF